MKTTLQTLTALSLLAFSTVALAHCGECGKKDGATDAATAQCDAGGCPVAAAMGQLPKITYAVGEETACCPKAAAKLLKENGGHIHYVVGEEQFDSEADAHAALVKATEEFVAAFAEPHTCPASGNLVLAGQPQTCEKSAGHLAKLMQDAMGEVQLTYMVGEEECHCPIKAGQLAEQSGEKKQFVVGEEATCCEQTARLNLARAKYKAAVTAMVEAQKPAEEAAPAVQGS